MVRAVCWGQVSDHSQEPKSWNVFYTEDTADKLELKDQLLHHGDFTGVPHLRLLSIGDAWLGWDSSEALPAGDLEIKVIYHASGDCCSHLLTHIHEQGCTAVKQSNPASQLAL